MSFRVLKAALARTGVAACVVLLASGAALADVNVTLTASPTTTTLPDGQTVPMWGLLCGTVGTTGFSYSAGADTNNAASTPCTTMSGTAQTGVWQPPLITVPQGTPLNITLLNNLSFANGNTVPTSLVIVGQLGGGLGTDKATMPSPTHGPQGTTWPGTLGTTNPGDPVFTPPPQVDRVRSMATEVKVTDTAGKKLTWSNLRPGTYLIESGTQPSIQGPMGLYGVVVVTEPDNTAGAHVAYGTTFDSAVALLLSEIDPVQNREVAQVVQNAGFSDTKVWSGQPTACGDVAQPATAHTCYPPAVNYSPLYYLVNGVSFDRTSPSAVAVPAAAAQKNVLLRLVNAGLRMHVPSVVGTKMTLVAEDGNALRGQPRVQTEVFLAAGKTYDVAIQPSQTNGAYDAATYALFDRALSLSTSNQRDGGMQILINIAGGGGAGSSTSLNANDKTYTCFVGSTLSITDPSNGLLAGATGASGVVLATTSLPAGGTLDLQSNGTFTYTPPATGSCAGSFTYKVNGAQLHTATINDCAGATSCAGAAPVAGAGTFTSSVASQIKVPPPGVLQFVKNDGGYSLTAVAGAAAGTCANLTLNSDGSFIAAPAVKPTTADVTCQFTYNVSTTSKLASAADGTITITFPVPSKLGVTVKDGPTGIAISDYRWIIEEDRTFWIDPKCQINSTDPALRPSTCPPLPVESLGYNFHSASMPVVATGCVGKVSCEAGQQVQGSNVVCDVGNGSCRAGTQKAPVDPADVHLDPNKRYFISILPGDAINPTASGYSGSVKDCGPFTGASGQWALYDPVSGTAGNCGHGMGGSQLAPGQTTVSIGLQQIPLPTAKISVFVFQDDAPLNGENDAGGGVDVIAPNEAGLGGFELKLFDQAGQLGDNTGQITYDEFNQPVSNSLAGQIDPITGLNACPITARKDGLVGMIPTCPKFESDGKTPSPLAGQAVIANLYPGLYEIQAYPAADRIAAGEEWLQTNTLDGGKPHEAFIKPNEPGYFQEFGPGGFHVAIGFANPATINARKAAYCASAANGQNANGTNPFPCTNTFTVQVTNNHMSRTPDQRTFSSETYDHYAWTNCYVSIGPADGQDFAFQKCAPDGSATFTNMPPGVFKITVFDQWNDIMLDGLVGTIQIAGGAAGGASTTKEFPVTQWRTNLYTRTYIDDPAAANPGVSDDSKPGLSLVNTNIRYRDGSIGFFNNTDLNGYAGFNEVFPLMNWLVVDTSQTRFKPTWTHVVYDAGGTVDGSAQSAGQTHTPNWTSSTIAANLANTDVRVPLPVDLRVPGAKYCDNADCLAADAGGGASTGMLFPSQAFGNTVGWQGLLGQNTFIEFGVKPFKKATANTPAENGGISGQVIYASTRPFDDPTLLLQLSWEPGIANAKVNLYRKTVDASGNEILKLVDTTQTASWDDWAQGFRKGADGTTLQTGGSGANAGYVPNMNCPGQDNTSPFFATLKNSKMWLDTPAAGGSKKALAYQSQFKCYDGWSQLNQAQPAPYDGYYRFPSITAIDPSTGKPSKTNCTGCTTNPDDGNPMLPAGTYVVEIIVPPGYELVKEEDKNILMGDVFVAPVTQQFAGFGNVFIMPDQAAVNAYYNANSPGGLNLTTNIGSVTFPRHEGDTGSIEAFWPCVGALRQVPDFNAQFPGAGQAAPFAGAMRHLCDRKEVKLADESSTLAKFYLFSSTHIAGHFTGTITNDFASEFDPFSPQFGEKFGPPNLPVGVRDFNGNEVARVYSDQWGIYNGLYFSTWTVNPPNPTGYAPQMSIACMNDPGPITVNGVSMTDPSYNPAYSNFCYEQPFMPGTTTYMDTPVIPTQAFADNYNLPDTEYPDGTPAISTVTSSAAPGPWVPGAGGTLTINSLGDKVVQNPYFAGPNANTAPYNTKTITRHYGFGAGGTGFSAVLVAPDGKTTAQLTNVSWSDSKISATVPTLSSTFNCKIQQKNTPTGTTTAQCGQLVITRGDNGKRSIDAITVTVGGTAPWIVTPTSVTPPANKIVRDYADKFGRMKLDSGMASPLQVAIDSASPGDLILVTPGTYHENLIMWKPVRLQGAGGGAVAINADAHPAGHMDQWRRQNNCVFGLDLNGVPNLNDAMFDPTGGGYACPTEMHQRVDRIPFEAIVGWDASGNGNLAQVLQEPTLMGAYEGAGITVLGRGVRIPASSTDFWGRNATGGAGAFTDGSRYLTSTNVTTSTQANNLGGAADTTGNDCLAEPARTDGRDYGTSNFYCNPSRIDGIAILNSSQGGGGLFIHGWAHNLEVANTRISANHGTLAGAINLGNGETPDAFINDGTSCGVNPPVLPCPPIPAGTVTGAAIPFQFNVGVRIHHNMLWNNASIGDALFSGTPAGAGAITVSAGADNYLIDHNWVAGNLSTGDGGGLQHLGLSFNGQINNNVVLFNQSTNPTLPTSGGGIVIEGANLDRQLNGNECGSTSDQDCPPGLGEGTGSVRLDGNLIYGNSAESGTGGGIRIQQVNGSADMIAFPLLPQPTPLLSPGWNTVTLTNNIIANNVAGYDGGGVSLQDALMVTLTNNTIASNDTTASAGVLFKTLGAITSNTPPPGCTPTTDPTLPQSANCTGADAPHGPQPSGLVTMAHTPNLLDAISGITPVLGVKLRCPVTGNFGYTGTLGANGDCMTYSRPALVNDMFWQNRTFAVNIVSQGTGLLSQQNLVALSPALTQTSSGACPSGAQFWDVGLRTDDVNAGTLSAASYRLVITNSIMTFTGDIGTANETVASATNRTGTANPVVAQVCNGARVPPEYCSGGSGTNGQNGAASCAGYNAPPGASETTSLPTLFAFSGIQPTATVDEGHNWLNLVYGPLYLGRPGATTASSTEQMVAGPTVGSSLGAYSIPSTSAAIGGGTTSGAPSVDFYGNARTNRNDIGAVQYAAVTVAQVYVLPTALTFTTVVGTTSATQNLTLTNNGNATFTVPALAFAPTAFSRNTGGTFPAGAPNCGATLAAGASCTIKVQFTAPATAGTTNGTLTIAGVIGSPVALTGTAQAATFRATVTPATLDFGNWATGTTSAALNVTITNTGNSGLAGLAFTFGGGTPQPFSRVTTGTFPNGAPNCGTTLAVASSCTVKVQFAAPSTVGVISRTLTVSATGATITPSSVTLVGTSVASRAPVSILAPTITLPTGVLSGTGLVTFSNTAATGGSQVNVTNIAITNPNPLQYIFNIVAGTDGCTGVPLTPGSSCTVTVRFTNLLAARGSNRTGTITFTDTGLASPQSATLTGFATP